MYELAAATVEYGRQVGARVLEGYPTEPTPGKTVIWDEASVGLLQVFIDAGYEVEASPTLRRGSSDTDSANVLTPEAAGLRDAAHRVQLHASSLENDGSGMKVMHRNAACGAETVRAAYAQPTRE